MKEIMATKPKRKTSTQAYGKRKRLTSTQMRAKKAAALAKKHKLRLKRQNRERSYNRKG
jgi:hypothetical protein